ncbi:hypothetical protein TNCV_4430451 [Trichonephila clavipes]|nr:hypothetical protein TNCV_4430451 [Trichonephila clavipes]
MEDKIDIKVSSRGPIDGARLIPSRMTRERLQENNSSMMDKCSDMQTTVWCRGIQDGPESAIVRSAWLAEIGEQTLDSSTRSIFLEGEEREENERRRRCKARDV